MDVEHLKSKADNETYDIADATARAAINELNSKIGNLIKWTSASTVTTGASGNIALGISTSNLVLAVTADGYYVYPFRNSSGQWFAKVCNFDDLSHVNNTSISYRVCYIEF